MYMATQRVKTWDVLQSHPIAKEFDAEAQLALVCEFVDLYEDLQGMTLSDFVDAWAANTEGDAPEETEAAEEPESDEEPEPEEVAEARPSTNEDSAKAKPKPLSMVGMRVVYRFEGRNILSNEAGVTRDSGGTVAFTDVDGEEWSNAPRDHVYPIDPANKREIHIAPREAKEIEGWLNGGKPVKGHAEGTVLRSMTVEFSEHPDKITFVVMNAKKPYVDRFVMLPNNGFEDDQKPTRRLFGEHCFRVRGKDYVVNVVSP
jgi:hypothetical protein